MGASNVEDLYCALEDEIISDIEETADEDFRYGDISMAIKRTLFKRLNIEQ